MPYCTRCGKLLIDGEACLCHTPAQSQPVITEPKVEPVQSQPITGQEPQVTPVQPQVAPVQPIYIQQPQMSQGVYTQPMYAQSKVLPKQNQTQVPNVFIVFLTHLWAFVVGVIKTPVESIKSFVEKPNAKVIFTLIGIQAILKALFRMIDMLITNSKIDEPKDYLNSTLSELYNTISSTSSLKFSAGEIIWQMIGSLCVVIGLTFVIALIIMLAIYLINKTKVTWIQGLSVASLTLILAIPATLIAGLLGLVDENFATKLGDLVLTFATAIGAIYAFFGMRTFCKNENILPLVAGLCGVGSVYLIGFIF